MNKYSYVARVILVFFIAAVAYSLMATSAFAQFNPNALPSPVTGSPVATITPGGNTVTKFNNAISSIRGQTSGSGTILFKSGTYSWNRITMANNIHVRFENNVTIELSGNNARSFFIRPGVENCSVVGPNVNLGDNRMTTIIIRPYNQQIGDAFHLAALSVGGTNCEVRNLRFLTQGASGDAVQVASPARNITVQNIHARPVSGNVGYTNINNTPTLPGWSTVQYGSGTNIKIDNVSGYGGVTLRMEQGQWERGKEGQNNLTATDITNYYGRAAVVLAPIGGILPGGNKNINISNVKTFGSGWGVNIGVKKDADTGQPGTYQNAVVNGLEVYYDTNAQYRWDERPSLPSSVQSSPVLLDIDAAADFYRGPSIGPVYNPDNISFVGVNNVKWFGFPSVYNFNSNGRVASGSGVDPTTFTNSGGSYNGSSGTTISHRTGLNVAAGNRNFSVEFCIRPEQGPTGQWRAVVHKGASNGQRTFAMWLRPGDMKLHYRISTTSNSNSGGDTQTALPLNQATKVTYVREGNKLKIYINGNLDVETTLSGTVVSNTGSLHIGDSPWYPGTKGQIGDFKVYGNAINPSGGCTLGGTPPSTPTPTPPTTGAPSLTSVSGRLAQIDAQDYNRAIGVNAGGQIWYHNSSGWTRISGALIQASLGTDGSVWGINSAGSVYRRASATSGGWQGVSGKTLVQIDARNFNQAVGVDSNDNIHYYNNGSWTQISGKLAHVSIGADGSMWGINSGGLIYRRASATSGGWQGVSGGLVQIEALNYNNAVGVNVNGSAYYRDGNRWRGFAQGMAQVSYGANGSVWAMDSDGYLSRSQ